MLPLPCRSGSSEGLSPTTAAPNLIAVLSSSESTSVGTWKLIKGKVTQTFEDIKSSKTVIAAKAGEVRQDPDSDQENTNANTSNSEELPSEQESLKIQYKLGDSDSDIENEILLEGEGERSRLKRGLANLKSKVKTHHHHRHHRPHQQTATLAVESASNSTKSTSMDTSPSRTSLSAPSSTSSLRSGFLRKRKKEAVESAELATPSAAHEPAIPVAIGVKKEKGIIAGKKEIEIESGVEMLEDMVPPAANAEAGHDAALPPSQRMRLNMDLPDLKPSFPCEGSDLKQSAWLDAIDGDHTPSGLFSASSSSSFRSLIDVENMQLRRRARKIVPVLALICLVAVMLLPIPDFLRGVFACLLSIALIESIWWLLRSGIEQFLVTNPPEKTIFKIPSNFRGNINEIPNPVEEHKNIKSYAGWMNEVDSYDMNNFHITMSRPIYVKLEGTMLRISTTNARIPKRAMWNEPEIDRKTVTFLQHRIYNLQGCRVELLPLGLARKRYFNRKYPIQLIMKRVKCVGVESTSTAKLYNSKSRDDGLSERSSFSSKGKSDEPTDRKEAPNLVSSGSQPQSSNMKQLSAAESSEELTDRTHVGPEQEQDFANSVLHGDLQALQDAVNPDVDAKDITVPCGDEVRLLLFSRADREKEDWYRRFVAASEDKVHDQDLRLPNIQLVTSTDLQAAAAKAAVLLTAANVKRDPSKTSVNETATSTATDETSKAAAAEAAPQTAPEDKTDKRAATSKVTPDKEVLGDAELEKEMETPAIDDTFEGLLMSGCAARNPADYLRFMVLYQKAASEGNIPVYKQVDKHSEHAQDRRARRVKRQEDELWKGIDQSLFLGPSGSVVWFNVLLGRLLYSGLHDNVLQGKIQEFLQKKLSSIKLPSFMEDVCITQINLGDTPPLIHRVSRPVLDERGIWLDADVTYEGLLHITVTTKLNLLRLKRPQRTFTLLDTPGAVAAIVPSNISNMPPINVVAEDFEPGADLEPEDSLQLADALSSSAIFDSDAESSGGSSSEAESPTVAGTAEPNTANEFSVFNTSPGNARRIFKIVDRFAASNFFQYATELSYVQRAMENMSANITLRVDLKGLVGRATINIPPPPSDRVWLSFRGPPRLWISAKPAVGDKSFDWSIVTNIIESKLCEEVNKFLVYPNMVDATIPFLAQPTYKD